MTMRSRLTASIVALAIASASGSACAMSPSTVESERCRVIGGDKLPPEIGGAAGICQAIDRAAAADAPGVTFTVDVRVKSSRQLSASVTMADGRVLPERHLAISDSKIRKSSVDRFAKGIAAEIAKARG